jgi:hypothetical protein
MTMRRTFTLALAVLVTGVAGIGCSVVPPPAEWVFIDADADADASADADLAPEIADDPSRRTEAVTPPPPVHHFIDPLNDDPRVGDGSITWAELYQEFMRREARTQPPSTEWPRWVNGVGVVGRDPYLRVPANPDWPLVPADGGAGR